MRRFLSLGCRVTLLALGLTGWLAAQAMPSGVTFDIRAGTASSSLKEFASQAHLQLLFDYKALEKLKTPSVKGQLTPAEALKEMLEGSGFTFHEINDHTIAITRSGGATSSTGMQQEDRSGMEASRQGRPNSSSAFLLAQVTEGQSLSSTSIDQSSAPTPEKQGAIQEVIVTAQKREERLQDVPVPVTVLSSDSLLQTNSVRIQDFYSSVPGFNVSPSPGAGGQDMLVIRGISAGAFTNPTVGVTVDGVPLGSSTGFFGNVMPDIDPSDLARIEVLRGPQGTLYGASSLGGLLNFVTVDPSTDGITGRLEAGTSGVQNGTGAGYGFRGAVNLPVTDSLAIRASAFTRQTPGYIDNVALGIDGVNREVASGGHLSALWKLSDTFSLKLSALYQQDKVDGLSEVTVAPGLGDLQQNFNGPLGSDQKTQAYNATLNGKLGSSDFTAISGYNVNSFSSTLFTGIGGYGPLITQATTHNFSQELRLNVPIGEQVEWLVGAFYTDQHEPQVLQAIYANPSPNPPVNPGYLTYYPFTFTEYAGFTDVTWHITDAFNVQMGGRYSSLKQATGAEFEYIPLFGVTPATSVSGFESRADAFTYLVTPQLKISHDVMVYARFASGYRPGGGGESSSSALCVRFDFSCQYNPDKTYNYEIGIKGAFLDRRLVLDASAYYIDWRDIQITVLNVPADYDYGTNGGKAKSEGLELRADANPVEGLTLSAWATYSDAALTQSLPPNATVYGPDGSRLPFSTRFSGNIAVQQQFHIARDVMGFVGGTVSYIGDRFGTFVPQANQRAEYPAYTKTDFRAGATYESWTINLYATNAFDRRAVLGGGGGTFPATAFVVIQPRTIGLSVTKSF